jgi:hypothetical protein
MLSVRHTKTIVPCSFVSSSRYEKCVWRVIVHGDKSVHYEPLRIGIGIVNVGIRQTNKRWHPNDAIEVETSDENNFASQSKSNSNFLTP